MEYFKKDSERQEKIKNIVKEILELSEKNAQLEIENIELKEILQKNKETK
jgi:regulator of replication initiation timing